MHSPVRPVATNDYDLTDVPGARGKRRRPWLWLLPLLLVLGGALWFFLGRSGEPASGGAAVAERGGPQALPRVTVLVPGVSNVTDEVRVTGAIAARREMPVGVQGEGGQVNAVLVQEGDYIGAGQALARIDRAVQLQEINSLQAAIRQAEADAALAQSELERAQALVERGFISKADIERRTATRDSANARVAIARAQLSEAQARLARLDVRAPDDGLVLTRNVEPGQVVGPGSGALFRIAQNGAMEMRAQVAEQDLAKMRVGQEARVQLVGSPDMFDGQIWLIEPIIDPDERQGGVRIALGRDRRLRPGAFARATIATDEVEQPLLPQSAVQADDSGNFVLVVDESGRVERRPVEVGTISERGLSIRSGLTGRERVVESAGAFLNPGEQVIPVLRERRS